MLKVEAAASLWQWDWATWGGGAEEAQCLNPHTGVDELAMLQVIVTYHVPSYFSSKNAKFHSSEGQRGTWKVLECSIS